MIDPIVAICVLAGTAWTAGTLVIAAIIGATSHDLVDRKGEQQPSRIADPVEPGSVSPIGLIYNHNGSDTI